MFERLNMRLEELKLGHDKIMDDFVNLMDPMYDE
jgi:hypothetical protein